MHGNLWEWVEDPFKVSYQGAPADSRVWDEDGTGRAARGGSFMDESDPCRSANRHRLLPGLKGVFGFRVAMNAPEDGGTPPGEDDPAQPQGDSGRE